MIASQESLKSSYSAQAETYSPLYQNVVETMAGGIKSEVDRLERPLIVGINGVDGVGKTHFTQEVAFSLISHGLPVSILHMDSFTNPFDVRHSGPTKADNYYNRTFDFNSVKNMLKLIRQGLLFNKDFVHPDPNDDSRPVKHSYDIRSKNCVLLVEGVYIFRPEMVEYFDYKIYLGMPLDSMLDRGAVRDVERFGDASTSKYEDKYIPAQRMYITEANPARAADYVIDFTDWKIPRIITPLELEGSGY